MICLFEFQMKNQLFHIYKTDIKFMVSP